MPYFRWIPPCLLAVTIGLDVVTHSGVTHHVAIDLVISGLAALVLIACLAVVRSGTASRALRGALFVAMVLVNGALVIRSPIFGFYTFTGYIWVIPLLDGNWRPVGVVAVGVTVAISQTGGGPGTSGDSIGVFIAVLAINVVVAGGVMWLTFADQEKLRYRQEAIDELTEANRKLEELQAQLVAQAREAGVAEERQRLAREIHDTLAQGLIGIITQLQAAGVEGSPGSEHIDAAIALARESLSEARRSVQALAPEPLQSARLPDALSDVASRWSRLSGVQAQVTTTGVARAVRPEVEVALLRTAQEALANVAKHAHAQRVGLTLSYMEDVVTLDVRDDGVGFRNGDAHAGAGGFGLEAMRQRIAQVAGTLEIESERDGGTAVCASVPVGGDVT
jgi:signal transduction histidine kinase